MEELMKMLKDMKDAGAPAWAIQKMEAMIERRALRIRRHDDEVRAWRERQATDKKDDSKDWMLLMFLLLLLESDNEYDQFSINDMLPAPPRPATDPTGFLLPIKTETEGLDDERQELAAPKW